MVTLTNRLQVGQEAWNAFVDAQDEAWFWHRYELIDTLNTWGKEDLSFAALDEKGEIKALMPLHYMKGRALKKRFSWNQMDSLGGPVLMKGLADKERKKIVGMVKEKCHALANDYDIGELQVSLPVLAPAYRPNVPAINPLLQYDLNHLTAQTWLVHLEADLDQLWNSFEGRARTSIRKAEKSDVGIRMATTEVADLQQYYDLHLETCKRSGIDAHPYTYFEKIWANFLKEKLCVIFFAEQKGEIIAAENVAFYKEGAIYWTGASNNKALDVNCNSLLQWHAMKWMKDHGVKWYESGEAFPYSPAGKQKKLSDFKKSFGGQLTPFYKGKKIYKKKKFLILEFIRSCCSLNEE